MKRAVALVLAVLVLGIMAVAASAADQKILVVYFSETGHTQEIAGFIADSTKAEQYRITAADPYTEKDLSNAAKRDPNSRVNKENKDDSARPAIAGDMPKVSDYDVIFVGYPIWFGHAPKIIRTFLEAADLSGKTIVTFCTSGSSEIGGSTDELRGSLSNTAKLHVGRSFRSATRADVVSWINSLGIGVTAQ